MKTSIQRQNLVENVNKEFKQKEPVTKSKKWFLSYRTQVWPTTPASDPNSTKKRMKLLETTEKALSGDIRTTPYKANKSLQLHKDQLVENW